MMERPTIVLTGATGGLGRLAAIELARRGAHLVLIARDKAKAEVIRALIEAVAPQSTAEIFLGDLSSMSDVRRVGTEIATAHPSIDVLINNAGLHAFEQRITVDGFPIMVAVNYLAPWLLTHFLRPALITAVGAHGEARVVTVASEASRRHGKLALPADLTDISPFTALGSSLLYGKSKLLDILFSQELARRLEGTRVTANALCPGFNVTGLGRELRFAAPLERMLRALRIGDPAKGAGIMVHLAIDPEFRGTSGGYFSVKGGRPLTPVWPGGDLELQARLWAQTEQLLAA
ncbi:MAG TPA: SDR family NAD(P)-dependent oxidoreductase [Rhodanobacter sp.]|jgi:NAD(P)-dependent dehydrogenase (short-subunit alcohol dehydrogenase family)|nr:SDR family NAD(P)-dependent oxidoreductase [Rhodanobacter sp.]